MTDTRSSGTVPIDLLRGIFGLDPEDVRQALGSIWRAWLGLREDADMPRIEPAASSMQAYCASVEHYGTTDLVLY